MLKVSLSLIICILFLGGLSFAQKEERWKGFDEVVIEKISEERGKEPKSLFDLEGDLELFAFSLLSGISGFVVGYFWRKFLSEKSDVSLSGETAFNSPQKN